jgi:hypothetical protein
VTLAAWILALVVRVGPLGLVGILDWVVEIVVRVALVHRSGVPGPLARYRLDSV